MIWILRQPLSYGQHRPVFLYDFSVMEFSGWFILHVRPFRVQERNGPERDVLFSDGFDRFFHSWSVGETGRNSFSLFKLLNLQGYFGDDACWSPLSLLAFSVHDLKSPLFFHLGGQPGHFPHSHIPSRTRNFHNRLRSGPASLLRSKKEHLRGVLLPKGHFLLVFSLTFPRLSHSEQPLSALRDQYLWSYSVGLHRQLCLPL